MTRNKKINSCVGLVRTLRHAILLLMLGGCAAVAADQIPLQPFTTDGCSRFPDRAVIGKDDWCHCCVIHDLAYWRGGTEQARQEADKQLRACVEKATNNKPLAAMMFAGVRAGGGPEVNTSYRWGYGWPYGRMYQALSQEEEILVANFEREYREKHPVISCEK
jgi:hypothetical protein